MIQLAVGALLMALAIVTGAFGSHALANLEPARARFWSIATEYHVIGALGVLVGGLLDAARGARAPLAFWFFLAGIALFSGSLYAMALGAPRSLGRVTPIGGLCLIAGWVALAVVALRHRGS